MPALILSTHTVLIQMSKLNLLIMSLKVTVRKVYCFTTSFSIFDILEAIEFRQDMFIWIDDQEVNVPKENIYENYFEKQFLQDTEQFYRLEAANFLAHKPVMEYLKRVKQRLHEEEHLVQSYLHSSTLKPLISKVEELLIRDQLLVIYAEAKTLLLDERNQG